MASENSLPTPPSTSATPTPVSGPTAAPAAPVPQPTDPASATVTGQPTPAPTPAPTTETATPTTGSGTGTGAGTATTTTAPAAAGAETGQQQQQQQQPQPPSPAEVLETLLQQIVASNSGPALVSTLLNSLGTPDAREAILASVTPSGADPLELLDPAQHTIGALFILCVLIFSFFFSSCCCCCVSISIRGGGLLMLPNCLGLRVSHPRQRLRQRSPSHTSRTSVGVLIQRKRATRLSVVSHKAPCPQGLSSRSDVPPSPLRPVTTLAKGIVQHAETSGPVRSFSFSIPVLTASFYVGSCLVICLSVAWRLAGKGGH